MQSKTDWDESPCPSDAPIMLSQAIQIVIVYVLQVVKAVWNRLYLVVRAETDALRLSS